MSVLIDMQNLIVYLRRLKEYYSSFVHRALNLKDFANDNEEAERIYWRAVGKRDAVSKILEYWEKEKEKMGGRLNMNKIEPLDASFREYVYMCRDERLGRFGSIKMGDRVVWELYTLPPQNMVPALVYYVDPAKDIEDVTLLNIITLDSQNTYHIVPIHQVTWLPRVDQLLELIGTIDKNYSIAIKKNKTGNYEVWAKVKGEDFEVEADMLEKALIQVFMRFMNSLIWDKKSQRWVSYEKAQEQLQEG